MGVGVRQRLTGVVACDGIAVCETDVLNTPSTALHCPPHTSWLLFLTPLGAPAHRACDLFPDEGTQPCHAPNPLHVRPHPRRPAGRAGRGGRWPGGRVLPDTGVPPGPHTRRDLPHRHSHRHGPAGRGRRPVPVPHRHAVRPRVRCRSAGRLLRKATPWPAAAPCRAPSTSSRSAATSQPDPLRPGRHALLGNNSDRISLVSAHSGTYLSDHEIRHHGGADVGDRAARPSMREWICRSGTTCHSVCHAPTARSGRRLKPGQGAASALAVPVNPMTPTGEYADSLRGLPPHRGIAVFRCGSDEPLTLEVSQP